MPIICLIKGAAGEIWKERSNVEPDKGILVCLCDESAH